MKTALIATLAVLGSTTAALAAPTPRHEVVTTTVSVKARTPIVTPSRTTVVRPVVERQPVVVGRRGERGHGPVVHGGGWDPRPVVVTPAPIITHPIVVAPPVVYTPPAPVYSPPIYQPSTLALGNDIQLYGAQFINIDRTLQKLTLSADRGATDIAAIQITFANGDIKTFNYNEQLDRSNPELTLNLGGRNVDNIVVFGHQASYGAQMDVTAGC